MALFVRSFISSLQRAVPVEVEYLVLLAASTLFWPKQQKVLENLSGQRILRHMTGILVACWVPGETGQAIALDKGEPVDQMHVTLVYLEDAPKEQLPDVVRAVAPVAMSSEPLEGAVTGRGRFYNDEEDVIYAVPSVPGLSELRERLRANLAASGFPDASEHGWTPHITLKYVSPDDPYPFSETEYTDGDRDRFMAFVKKEGGCWLWQGAATEKGYGMFKAGGQARRAHRVAYEMFVGPIPNGAQLLHSTKDGCRGSNCVNPKHLRPGSNEDNVADRYYAESWPDRVVPAYSKSVPIEFDSIEVRYGDEYRVVLPFGEPLEDEDEAFDMSEVNDVPDWQAETAWQFMEWFGYTIEPNPNSSLGHTVTSPSGKRLGGFVAKRIIEASQKTPDTGGGGKGKGKSKGKKGGGSKKAAVDPITAMAEAKGKAEEAIGKIDAIGIEDKSKGVLKAADIQSFVDEAKAKLANITDPKEAAKIITAMKKQIAAYKNELMPKPTAEVARALAVKKIKDALPSPEELAGDKFDPAAIKAITDKYDVGGARSPEKAREVIKEMRAEIAAYKKDAQAKAKAAKAEAAEIKAQAKDHVSLQQAAAAKGWETAEVIKGSAADVKEYQVRVEKLAKNNPDKQYVVIKAGDGSFGLLVKPIVAPKAQRSAVPAKTESGVDSRPEPNIKRQPVTASEWADYYVDKLFVADPEPEQFMAPGQPRDNLGKWTKGAGDSTVAGLEAKVAGGAAHNAFKNDYFGSDKAFMVNEYLRHGTERGAGKANSAKLMKAADKASVELPEAMEVQRSIRFRDGPPADFRKGAVITDKGFTSTTTSKQWAEYHARGKAITLTITLPKGTKVIPNSAEHELVLKPPSRYKITGQRGKSFTAELVM